MAGPWHAPGEQPRIWVRDRCLARALLVAVPELGGVEIEVRSMTFGERLNYFDIILVPGDDGGIATDWDVYYPALLIPCCWSPARSRDGRWLPGRSARRLWAWEHWEEVNALRSDALERLAGHAIRMSGLTKDEQSHAYFRITNDGEFRFAFDMADNLHCTVEELGDRLSAYEATWHRAYWQIRNWEMEQKTSSRNSKGEAVTFGGSSGVQGG